MGQFPRNSQKDGIVPKAEFPGWSFGMSQPALPSIPCNPKESLGILGFYSFPTPRNPWESWGSYSLQILKKILGNLWILFPSIPRHPWSPHSLESLLILFPAIPENPWESWDFIPFHVKDFLGILGFLLHSQEILGNFGISLPPIPRNPWDLIPSNPKKSLGISSILLPSIPRTKIPFPTRNSPSFRVNPCSEGHKKIPEDPNFSSPFLVFPRKATTWWCRPCSWPAKSRTCPCSSGHLPCSGVSWDLGSSWKNGKEPLES